MAKTKKQHYVPQSYLERFVSGSNLYVYDKFENNIFPANPRDVGHENYFYDLDEEFQSQIEELMGKKQPIEKLFQPIEEQASRVIRHILYRLENNKFEKIMLYEKKILASFLTLQYLRTRAARELVKEFYEKTLTHLTKMLPLPDELKDNVPQEVIDNIRVKMNPKYEPNFHLMMLFNPKLNSSLMASLMIHSWFICEIEDSTEEDFYSSDTPFVVIPTKKGNYGPYSGLGFGSYGVELFFPITPKLGLYIVDKNYIRENFGNKFLKKHSRKKFPIKISNDNVIHFNWAQLYNSHRFVFSDSDNFIFAKKYHSEHPEQCSLERERVSFN